MPIYQLGASQPSISPSAWIAPNATIIGKAQIDALASVWFGVVIRADNDLIHIGKGSNIQDGCVMHNDIASPLTIEPYVTVGHQAMLHACHVGEGSLIGMQAVLLSRCYIGRNSLIGAGSLVTQDQVFPDGVLILGRPAKVIRQLTDEEIQNIHRGTQRYIDQLNLYSKELTQIHV